MKHRQIITDEIREEYFSSLRDFLFEKSNRRKITMQRHACEENQAGVYCFFINGELGYVGESGCLKKRINDMLNTKNHSFRRSFGEHHFSTHKLYTKADSKNGYCAELESLLTDKMKEELEFSFIAMDIGRKEFEEWLQDRYPDTKFFNKRKKRK